MAQHIPTKSFSVKKVRDIGERMKQMKKWQVAGSLRFQRSPYDEQSVFITTRYVGKGIVAGDERATFEVHFEGDKVKEDQPLLHRKGDGRDEFRAYANLAGRVFLFTEIERADEQAKILEAYDPAIECVVISLEQVHI